MPADALDNAQAVGRRIGPYQIREKIGEGGMGVVYVAEQTAPVQRKVALKIIKPGMDTKEVIARFDAERQALAFMEHPNIARVLDAGVTEGGRSYFVMELVRGIPITEFCDQAKAKPRERLELFQTVCDAVQHAHQKGIIHRDIKPSNVLVTQVGAKPLVKVIDFGLAKAVSGQRLTEKTLYTGFMKLMGTPAYMSPEQAGLSGLDIDTRSDIYSLGVLLYELLTGTTPLDKTKIQKQAYDELCRQIREVDAPKPSTRFSTLQDAQRSTVAEQRQIEPRELRQMLDGDLDRVVLKAIEKDRDRRYASPQDLAADVGRFLDDEPVLAIAPTQWYLARKYMRRHRAAILTAATILLCLAVATVFSSWQAVRATAANKIAEERTAAALRSEERAQEAKQAAETAQEIAVASEQRAETSAEQERRLRYAANMQLADQLWHRPSGDLQAIQNLLVEWLPTDTSTDDLRDFAWRYQWTRLHHSASKTVYDVDDTTISINDQLVIVDKTGLREWDEAKKTFTPRLDASNFGENEGYQVSPCGRWVATTTSSAEAEQEEIRFIETATGDEVLRVAGNRVSFSRSGDLALAWREMNAGSDNLKKSASSIGGLVWNLNTQTQAELPENVAEAIDEYGPGGQVDVSNDGKSFLVRNWKKSGLQAFIEGKRNSIRTTGEINSAAWSLNGELFALGTFVGDVQVYATEDAEKTLVLNSSGGVISALDFSPNSTRLATGGRNGIVNIWDVSELLRQAGTSGQSHVRGPKRTRLLRSIKAHLDQVRRITFSSDGKKIATRSGTGTVKLWDLDADVEYNRVTMRADDLYKVDNSWITFEAESDERGIRIRELDTEKFEIISGEIRAGDYLTAVTNDSGHHTIRPGFSTVDVNLLLMGAVQSVVKLHVTSDGQDDSRVVEVRRTSDRDRALVTDLTFSPDGTSMLVADVESGALRLSANGHAKQRYFAFGVSVDVSQTGEFLAMDHGPHVVVWNLQNDELNGQWDTRVSASPIPFQGHFGQLAFSPDSRFLAFGTGSRLYMSPRRSDLRVWQLSTQTEVTGAPLLKNDSTISAVEFTPNGDYLLAASHDRTLRVWDTGTWTQTKMLKCPPFTRCLAVSPDGQTVAVGGNGVDVIDLDSGKLRYKLRDLHAYGLTISNDGRTLVATGADRQCLLIDARNGRYLTALEGHSTVVSGCDFSPHEKTLVTIDINGDLRLWHAHSLEEIDRHWITLKAQFDRGRQLNLERRFTEAKQVLRRTLQGQLAAHRPESELNLTRRELTLAIHEQGEFPAIGEQPISQPVSLGEPAEFTVTCINGRPDGWSYQWYFRGEPIENATESSLRIPTVSAADLGPYYVEAQYHHDDLDLVSLKSNKVVIVDDSEPVVRESGLRQEIYRDVEGTEIFDLTSSPDFPLSPNETTSVVNFETSKDMGDKYGMRLTGFITAPKTGDYVFYLCSDDSSELFLSADESPKNQRSIATMNGWREPLSWELLEPENISKPITLEAGQRYWVEALFKEGSGGDHFAVTWQIPDEPPPKNGDPPIPGEFLDHQLE